MSTACLLASCVTPSPCLVRELILKPPWTFASPASRALNPSDRIAALSRARPRSIQVPGPPAQPPPAGLYSGSPGLGRTLRLGGSRPQAELHRAASPVSSEGQWAPCQPTTFAVWYTEGGGDPSSPTPPTTLPRGITHMLNSCKQGPPVPLSLQPHPYNATQTLRAQLGGVGQPLVVPTPARL